MNTSRGNSWGTRNDLLCPITEIPRRHTGAIASEPRRESLSVEATNEELVRRCVLRPWEELFFNGSCLVSILLSVAVSGLTWWTISLTPSKPLRWLAVPLAFVAMKAAHKVILRTVRRRSAESFALLSHRLGVAPFSAYIEEFQARLLSRPDLDRVLLVQGSGLPGGFHWWVAVELTNCVDHPDSIEVRFGNFFTWFSVDPDLHEQFRLMTGELDERCADALRAMLGAKKMNLASIQPRVIDGFPCRLAVISDGHVTEAEANLTGLSEKETTLLPARLMNSVLDAGRSVLGFKTDGGS